MADFWFEPVVAKDSDSDAIAYGTSGAVYDPADIGFTTPLQVKFLSGLTSTVITVGALGVTPEFSVVDKPKVVWKSGSYEFTLVSYDSIVSAVADSALAVSNSAQVALAAQNAADLTYETVKSFKAWVDLAVTRSNYCRNPLAIGTPSGLGLANFAGYLPGSGESGTIATVADAMDGPVMPDGTMVTSYVEYTCTTAKTSGSTGWSGTANVYRGLIRGQAGDSVVAAVYARYTGPSTTQVRLRTQPYKDNPSTPGSTIDSATVTLTSGQWVRVSSVGISTDSFDSVGWWLYQTGGGGQQTLPVGGKLAVTAVLIDKASDTKAFFSGSSPGSLHRANRWTSQPNASVSEQIDMTAIVNSNLPTGGLPGQFLMKASGSDRDTTWEYPPSGGGSGTSNHSVLSNLTADDHKQYHNDQRGDARYYTKGQIADYVTQAMSATSALDRDRGNHIGSQAITTIIGLRAELDSLAAGGGGATLTIDSITDATVTGKTLVRATSAADARSKIGAAAAADLAGKADASALTTKVTGPAGMSIVPITKSAWQALAPTYPANTLYVFTGA